MCDDDVLALAEAYPLRNAATPEQHRLLETALRGRRERFRRQGLAADDLDCVCVPRWVYAAVCGDGAPALPLTVATYLLWTGIDLIDDAMDGDVPPGWQDFRPAEISLAGMTLACSLAPLAIATLDAPPATVVAMQQTLARGLLAMSAGQQLDLAMAGRSAVTVVAARDAAMGKTGEGFAMLAALAAQLARAPDPVVAAYAEMGRALGTARQLRTDCDDLFVKPHSKDLAHGAHTLPIAWGLHGLTEGARDEFLAQLDGARDDAAMHDAVRERLIEAGALWASACVIELHCQQARAALARAQPREPAARALHRLIDDTSILGHTSQREKEEENQCPQTPNTRSTANRSTSSSMTPPTARS